MLRVISGTLRGRALLVAKGAATRPTSGRVREALFDALSVRMGLAGCVVLDLYAGTGALGIEALSRGAAKAVFVDRDVRILVTNLRGLGLVAQGEAIQMTVEDFLQHKRQAFDLVLADPPYGCDAVTLLERLGGMSDLLENDGILVLEHAQEQELPLHSGNLHSVWERRYGATVVSMFGVVSNAP